MGLLGPSFGYIHHDDLAQAVVKLLCAGILKADILLQLEKCLGLGNDLCTIQFHIFTL